MTPIRSLADLADALLDGIVVLLSEPDRGLSESEALRAYAAGQAMGVRR